MSQPLGPRAEYTTVVPSGERLGDVSSPAVSVMRVNWAHRGSGGAPPPRGHHAAAAPTIASAAIVHGSHDACRWRAGTGASAAAGVDDDDVDPVESVSSANARSFADWNRSSGDFSRHRRTMRSRLGGIASRAVSSSGGSFVRIADMLSAAVSPAKARAPLSISYSTAPNANMSARWSTARPRTCSGAMYPNVPRIMPALVVAPPARVTSALPVSTGFARPKSRILT